MREKNKKFKVPQQLKKEIGKQNKSKHSFSDCQMGTVRYFELQMKFRLTELF